MPNDIDNITLCGTQIELSEDKSDPDIYRARFCISGFGVNKNNVQLDREHIEDWISTLVDKPVVGKVSISADGKLDFESHNLRIITKKKNNKTYKEAEFDTTPFGHFTSASIETAEDGNEYIYADAVLYKRYKNAIGVLERRMANNEMVSTSWEIAVEESQPKVQNGKIVKVVTSGRFLAHCFLGANVEPAFDESGLLAVASKQEQELDVALSQDCIDNLEASVDIQNTEEKEVAEMDGNKVEVNATQVSEEVTEVVETSENVVSATEQVEASVEQTVEPNVAETVVETSEDNNIENDNDVEASALTERDLHRELGKAYEQADGNGNRTYGYVVMLFPADNIAWFKDYRSAKSELDLVEVKYTVENDNVTITERNPVTLTVSPREINQIVAQKDNAIVEMSAQIQSLNDKVAELQPYKDKVDEIEKAEREAQLEKDRKELSDYAISSGYITQEELESSEEIKGYIENLDRTSIKSIISDRVVASLAQKQEKEVETSEANIGVEPNIQINLASLASGETKEKGTDLEMALSVMKTFLGR